MCFSPEVDLVAGVVFGAIGVDALAHTEDRRDLALASVPLVLAAHQLIESVVWSGLEGRWPSETTDVAIAAYLVIALGVVPALIPWAVMRTERDPRRRSMMVPFVMLGAVVAAVLIASLASAPYGATIGGRYIAYRLDVIGGGVTATAYAAAVLFPLLLSSSHRLVVFGALNALAFFALSMLLAIGLISLWCVWAAISSVVIVRYLREKQGVRSPTHPAAAPG
jgi:hypothetical protein